MSLIINVIVFCLIMGIIVFIHELGHLIAAKMCNVYCSEFAIGMGPKIFAIQGKETVYTIRLLPIGGFVAMAGEDDHNDDNIPFERTINGIKKYQKIIVLLAGIFMNILLAFVVNNVIYLYQGKARVDGPLKVVNVAEQSNASKIGFQKDDLITKIILENNKEIIVRDSNDALTYLVADKVSQVVVERNNQEVSLNYIQVNEKNKTSLDGIELDVNVKDIQWYEAPYYAFNKIKNDSTTILRTLSNLVRGIGLQQVSGPVGIFNVVGTAASRGFLPILSLLSLLSLNIGLFNAIPIPALDGGRVVLTILEKIMGKYYSKKVETGLIVASFGLLLLLIIFTVFNDVIKLL